MLAEIGWNGENVVDRFFLRVFVRSNKRCQCIIEPGKRGFQQFCGSRQDFIIGIGFFERCRQFGSIATDRLKRGFKSALLDELRYLTVRIPICAICPLCIWCQRLEIIVFGVVGQLDQDIALVFKQDAVLDGLAGSALRLVDDHDGLRFGLADYHGNQRRKGNHRGKQEHAQPEALCTADLADFTPCDEGNIVHHDCSSCAPTMWTKTSCRLAW